MDSTFTGVVEYFSSLKHFGFIAVKNSDGSRTKFFVHGSQLLNGEPVIGSIVRFKGGPTPQGRALALAEQVVILKDNVRPVVRAAEETVGGAL